MSNLAHKIEDRDHRAVDTGDLSDIRPIPRITIQAFCETDIVRQTLEACARDRRMARAHVSVHTGGIPAAADFYGSAPSPNLVIVETQLGEGQVLPALAPLADVCEPDTKVIILGHVNDIALYRELISNGVSDYLIAPVSMADIMAAVSSIFVNPQADPIGRVLAFIGAKGGSGSSTVCHNTAWTIATRYSSDVVLADLDLAFGTANINLDCDPTQGVAEAVFSPDRIDDILLDRLLHKCSEHLSLLAAPSTLERVYDFDRVAFSNMLEISQRSAPCVAVDVPHQWTAWTRQVLSSADEVIITANPELANLRNAKNMLDTLKDLRPHDKPARLVMSQVGVPKRPEISVAEFCAPLGVEPVAVIPFDPGLFGTASTNGQMIGEVESKNPVAHSFDLIAQVLTGRSQARVERKSKLSLSGLLRRKR